MTAPEQPGCWSPDPHHPPPPSPYGPPSPCGPPAPGGNAAAYPPPHAYVGQPKGLAIAALVVGIVAFLFGLVPVFGLIAGAAAVVLGILALRRRQSTGLAVTGLSLGAVAAITTLFVTLAFAAAISTAGETTGTAEVVESRTAEALPAPEATVPPVEETTAAAEPAAPAVPADSATALIKVDTYADGLDMSKAGLHDQLTSEYGEEFTAAEADYAIAHLDD